MLEKELEDLFNSISKKNPKPVFGVIDRTIDVEDLVKFLNRIEILWNETPKKLDKPSEEPAHKEEPVHETPAEEKHDSKNLNETSKSKPGDKSKIIKPEEDKHEEPEHLEDEKTSHHEEANSGDSCPSDRITLVELINIIEKYYNPKKTLAAMVESKISASDYNKEYKVHKLANRYYVHIKGSELILHEFKEILLEISILIKNKNDDSGKPKIRSMLKKFIEETLLKRHNAFTQIPISKGAPRTWPDSHKDKLI